MFSSDSSSTPKLESSLSAVLPKITKDQQDLLNPKRAARQAKLEEIKASIRHQGFEEGYAEGLVRGRADGFEAMVADLEQKHEEIIEQFVSDLETVGRRIHEAISSWYEQAEAELQGLAVEIASRIVHAELELSREATFRIAKEALQQVLHGQQVRIRVNPFDLGLLEAKKSALLGAATRLRSLEVAADPSIGGGCVIESDGGLIDARIEQMIGKLAEEARRVA